MPITIKYYGTITEITTIEKEPQKARVLRAPRQHDIYKARRPDSLRRTRNICMRRVSTALVEFGSPLMLTLTFRGTASDANFATQSLSRFQRRLRAKYPLAQSLFIPEISPRGRIHFHGLLFNVPLSLGDTIKNKRRVAYGVERKTRELADLWGEGFVDAIATDGSGKLATYISKYITKGAGHVLFASTRLLRVSNGFPREIVVKDEYLISK